MCNTETSFEHSAAAVATGEPMTAALYARVSSDHQEVDFSVAAQMSFLGNYARANVALSPGTHRVAPPGHHAVGSS